MPYEVDAADGRCLYRGYDLELACEIHDQAPTARLLVLATSTLSGDVEASWTGPSVASAA
jgi:hypothetical protein